MAVELMAGSRRMAHAFAKAGSWAVSVEIADAPRQDVLNTRNRRWLHSLMKAGLCRIVWVGLVCASWSLARRNVSGKPGFPPPLRDSGQFIWGLPNLSDAGRERVKAGNKQLRWAVSLFTRLSTNNVPCIIENPLSSRVWKAPPMRRLLARFPSVELHYCAYGMSWKKPTRLLYCHADLSKLGVRLCQRHGGVCSFTKEPHVVLSGYSKEHKRMWSSVASAYPPQLCAAVARIACRTHN